MMAAGCVAVLLSQRWAASGPNRAMPGDWAVRGKAWIDRRGSNPLPSSLTLILRSTAPSGARRPRALLPACSVYLGGEKNQPMVGPP